jgi:hypothetical protein
VLAAGSHPFIVRSSYVYYATGSTARHSHVVKMLEKRWYREAAPFEDKVFARISAGVLQSRDTAMWFKMDYSAAIRRGF